MKDLIESAWKDSVLAEGKALMESAASVADYKRALQVFFKAADWKDAAEQIALCKERIAELNESAEVERRDRMQRARIAEQMQMKRAVRNRRIVMVFFCALAAVGILAAVLICFVIPNRRYRQAVSLMDEGDLESAYAAFLQLKGYADAADKAAVIRTHWIRGSAETMKPGDSIVLGTYEQDNERANGEEEIRWRVLAVEEGRALVVSEYALDCRPYHDILENVTWETCSLRSWLNEEFMNIAFSEAEKAMISESLIDAENNPSYSTEAGRETRDRVFLLSMSEVTAYLGSDISTRCEPTAYAVYNGIWPGEGGNCWWWLRNPGYDQRSATYVRSSGTIYGHGDYANYRSGAVRPAMWIVLTP